MRAATEAPSATNALTALGDVWLWVRWVFASAVPMYLCIGIQEHLATRVDIATGFVLLPLFFLGTVGLIGILQALVLRPYIDRIWIRAWPIYTLVGWFIGLIAGFAILWGIGRLGPGYRPVLGTWLFEFIMVSVGAGLGLFQWLTLRYSLRNAWIWILLSPAAWAIAGCIVGIGSFRWVGVVVGAITGLWLARVLPQAASQKDVLGPA